MTTAPQLTDEQQAALSTRDVSVALDAGAGCGKTFVLTERFLSHLDPTCDDAPPAELQELIAITFTEAAAREMRKRIRSTCLERLNRAEGSAGSYWLSLLRAIESARVNTIHSFCGSLIRTHAVELGIDPLFRVLDEASAQVMRSEAVDHVLGDLLEARDPRVMGLATEYDLPGLKQRLNCLLPRVTEPDFVAGKSQSAAELVRTWQQSYEQDYLPTVMRDLGKSYAAAEVARLLPQAEPASERFRDVRDQLLEALAHLAREEPLDLAVESLRELTMIRGVTKSADWPDKQSFEDYKAACKTLRTAIDKVDPLASEAVLERAARLGLDLMEIAQSVDAAYREAKQSLESLDYDDLLSEACRLLTQPEFAETQKRLQQGVRLLMVDEFQDTDRRQVAIVKALVGPGLEMGRLFFVGDYKQSIYRFRGAEPQVFQQLQEETSEEGRLPLAMNFRSQPAILNFVNSLFSRVLDDSYQELRPSRPQTTTAPTTEFLWTPIAKSASIAASRQAEARTIARRIRALIDSQEPVVGYKNAQGEWEGRPAKAGDVAILFRALGDVQYYEQALRDEQLEYHLVGGHAFYSQQEVFDVANLLRAVASECDEIALLGVLRSPFFSLADESLLWIANHAGGVEGASTSPGCLATGFYNTRVPEQLSDQEAEKLHFARETLHALREQKGRANVAQILVDAVRRTSYDAILLSEFLGHRKVANLEKLVEQARAFDAYRPGDLDGFVRQLSEFVANKPKEALAATRDRDADEVQLMTVHGSKGLEFPIVVLADLDRKTRADTDPAAYHAQLGPLVKPSQVEKKHTFGLDIFKAQEQREDRRELDRLFYVACTRAADNLILSASYALESPPLGPWLKTLDAHFDLATGELRSEDPRPCATETPGPLVRVSISDGNTESTPSRSRGVDRRAVLAKAADSHSAPVPPRTIRPVAFDPMSLCRFSVSRLTGKLQYATARPAAQAMDAMLDAPADRVDPRGFGTLVHAALERMAFDGKDPVETWCRELAPLHLNRSVEQGAGEAGVLLQRFQNSPRHEQLRTARQVHREVEFLLPWAVQSEQASGDYLQGYLDCLVQDENGAWTVLDYKTNRVDAEGVTQAAEEYRLQLYVYAMAVEHVQGQPPASLAIHFLRPQAEVTFDWDAQARQRGQELVDRAIASVREEAQQRYLQESTY